MGKIKKLIYISNFNKNGESLQSLLTRIIEGDSFLYGLKSSYLPRP